MADLEIFVFVLGSSRESIFSIRASEDDTVSIWREHVHTKGPSTLTRCRPADLTLFKLKQAIPSADVQGMDDLALRQDLSSIAIGMVPSKKLSYYFPEAPPRKSLHVIVQPPSLPSAGEKHGRLFEDDADDEPASKRKKSVLHRARALHDAIKNLDNDLDLSNPATFVMLPFPSLLPASVERFQATKKEGEDVEYFRYMGRSKFTQLKECIQSGYFFGGRQDIYLYGSSGSGKSHILAALVCQLIREGKRVAYIPDCRDLLKNPYETIWIAFYCAFYDDPASLQTIRSARDVQGLLGFWRKTRDRYLVVDQVNALENDPSDPNLMDVKRWLNEMSSRHRYIYSASSNENSNRDVELKQASIKVISLLGGMDEEETTQWFMHHSNDLPTLSNDDRQRVEYLTGSIPLLLRSLFEFKGKTFDEREFMGYRDLTKVNKDVTKYFNDKLEESQGKQARYFEIMEACLQGAHVATDLKEYDLRYFYVDDNKRGRYTCGVVFESMMMMLRERRFQEFYCTNWHVAVSETKNPIIQGFRAEQICLYRISMHGLRAVSGDLTKMDVAPFHEKPAWANQIHDRFTLRLYTPIDFNFASIDAIILWLDFHSKKAHLYPIQITLSRNHKNSEDVFYAEKWRSWFKPIENAGFTVDSTFVWIDKQQPAAQPKEPITVSIREGVKTVQPKHHSIHVGIGQVNAQLARALSL